MDEEDGGKRCLQVRRMKNWRGQDVETPKSEVKEMKGQAASRALEAPRELERLALGNGCLREGWQRVQCLPCASKELGFVKEWAVIWKQQ